MWYNLGPWLVLQRGVLDRCLFSVLGLICGGPWPLKISLARKVTWPSNLIPGHTPDLESPTCSPSNIYKKSTTNRKKTKGFMRRGCLKHYADTNKRRCMINSQGWDVQKEMMSILTRFYVIYSEHVMFDCKICQKYIMQKQSWKIADAFESLT